MFRTIRRSFAAATLAALTLGVGLTTDARACEPVGYWKTVTVYVPVEHSRFEYVTRYDHCGRPYQVKVLITDIDQVPVLKRVRVYA